MSFPDLLYSENERALADALRSLLADQTGALARTESAETYDTALWHKVAADLGLAGLLIPERSGGAGASVREAATAAEELGGSVAPVPFLGSAVVATTALLSCVSSAGPAEGSGSREAEHLLGRMADGSLTVALAVPFSAVAGGPGQSDTAPGTRFPTTLRIAGLHPGDNAAGWSRLRGSVGAVADALPAGMLLVPADGVPRALYVVDLSSARVNRTPVVSLDMTRQLCDISFDDAPATMIASGEAASRAFDAALIAGACVLAAEELGVAQRCLDMTVSYVKERRQFARPVGSFQALKHRLADLWVTVAQARAASRYAAGCAGSGSPDALLARETKVAVALAKAYCSEAAVQAAQECVQLHGGIGFTWEHPAHLYLKRAKADSLAFGTAETHRQSLAGLVNLPAP